MQIDEHCDPLPHLATERRGVHRSKPAPLPHEYIAKAVEMAYRRAGGGVCSSHQGLVHGGTLRQYLCRQINAKEAEVSRVVSRRIS